MDIFLVKENKIYNEVVVLKRKEIVVKIEKYVSQKKKKKKNTFR